MEQGELRIMQEKELTGQKEDWGFTLSEMTDHQKVSSRGVARSELASSHNRRPARRQL